MAIIQRNVKRAFKAGFKDYALAVIQDRALPDVCTGIKPVQRRILYSMHELGMTPTKPEKKAAKVVGDVLGSYHPHGDTSVYDALVNLVQPWNMRYPLIQGDSNFGSRDGDPAAAYRYTTCKLTDIGELMCKDIDKETVNFMPNFDESTVEPIALPSLFPNLIANGSKGIAVSLATNIFPHNVTEVYNACLFMIDKALQGEDYYAEDILQYIPGPDFPDGGIIIDNNDMLKIITTGKGRIVVKAKVDTIISKAGDSIIIKELPYQVNKPSLVSKIDDLRINGTIEGIKEVIDATSRGQKCNIIIKLKKGTDPNLVLNQLYAKTKMKESFTYNIRALDENGQPHEYGIMGALEEFLGHGVTIIQRRSAFDYDKAIKKVELLNTIMLACRNKERVLEIITNDEDSVNTLMAEFNFTEDQAKYIDNMKASAFRKSSIDTLQEEIDELNDKIETLGELKDDEFAALSKLSEELTALRDKIGDERRTEIIPEVEITDEDLIKDEDLIITITSEGNIKSVPATEYTIQNRNGKGVKGADIKDDEIVTDLFAANSKDDILFITNLGRAHKIKAYKLPRATKNTKGKNIVNYMDLIPGEVPIKTLIINTETDKDKCITLVTDKGQIKRILVSALSSRFDITNIIKLKEDHKIVDAILTEDDDQLMITSAKGYCVRYEANNIRPQGRTARGVIGMKFKEENDRIVSMTLVPDGCELFFITEAGLAKRTEENEFTCAKAKGGKGIRGQKVSEKSGYVVRCAAVVTDELIVCTSKGKTIRISADSINTISRNSYGNKTIKLDKDDKVVAISGVSNSDILEED